MAKQFKNKLFCQCWSKYLFQINLFAFYTIFTLDAGISTAESIAKLEDWRFDPKVAQLEISLSAPSQPHFFYLSQPPRIVVDLPTTKLGYVSTQKNYSGAITSIRVSQFDTDITRIVIDLAPGTIFNPNHIQLKALSRQNPTRWILRPFPVGNSTSLIPEKSPPPPSSSSPTPGLYNSPASTNSTPNSGKYNPLSPSNNTTPNPNLYYPPPPTNNSSQQPLVTVPPLVPNSSSQTPNSVLPPPIFPNQPGNLNNIPFFPTPNLPVPTAPKNRHIDPGSKIIEFGQPLPSPTK
ncbi:AMIN domain-containing protein [Chlorogloeopsis sp. ULAP01]|uniref:AMIN domain-containing protein n=1 Tax=Chlorogloeopsis sp. ULAP01 TaxID=3056483 RepID=UPI0025AB4DF3|nr:AMIN domain-containing protein [Chlorogloeopsis sp. ULAP01]MDM9382196.1 AMIN domain-containing protein [Chlorogloeopsis sp. ULAP01]